MRVAVVSDIHGNLHALEAVLADIDAEQPDELWCLGDLVGYGPRPNECVALVRDRAALALVGNHDLAAVGKLGIAEFGPLAALSARWTTEVLSPESADWLRCLEPAATRNGVALFHGSPRDPVWEYVLSEEVALLSLLATTARLLLVGHSHLALAISWDETKLDGGLAPAGADVDVTTARFLLNPGSVGQPRDGDARAAWLLLDLAGGRASFRRVAYAIGETQSEIRAAGLPDELAARLGQGV